MKQYRLLDYLNRMEQSAADACGFVADLARASRHA